MDRKGADFGRFEKIRKGFPEKVIFKLIFEGEVELAPDRGKSKGAGAEKSIVVFRHFQIRL